ncbi:uncharacterized protein LOC120074263 isoform X2 [Benincasa hispida]|uniref:uncharacterized protein LOC120074263 isoform X2 n=1 Tax=Benincasa hispida TaxID=102211 RepID=UPI0018FFE631|nr:uncharacterized protein LOC120074263 isoform X2 [Benincasa hispida]
MTLSFSDILTRPNEFRDFHEYFLLEELSYEGLQGLLGLTHAGTVPDVLPPPRSALLSSFVLPYKPEFIGFLEPYMEDSHLKGWKHSSFLQMIP